MKNLNGLFTASLLALSSSQAYANASSVNTPEAATLLLICVGLFGLGLARRRSKKSDH